MSIPINPYIAGDPVGNSAAFVGREDVLRDVLKVLRNPGQNAITLFGQRRIGKTSMLQYLQSRLPQEGNYQVVYFDLQDKAAWPLPRLLFDLARTIADRLNRLAPTFDAIQAEDFRAWLKETLASLPTEASLVLLFDEFDVLTDLKSGQAAAEFFPYLRNLLSLDPARLQFIFVLGRNIDDLNSIALSVFKGIPSKRVSLLNNDNTFKVARLSEQNGTLTWSEAASQTVWKLTHGHPYLTQALCSQVWEAAYDEAPDETPQATPEMVEAAAPTLLEETNRNALIWLWNGLGPAEKVVSAALAGAGNVVVDETRLEQLLRESGVRIIIRELQNAPELLRNWDILEAVDGGYIFRVELLRRYIEKYHPLKRTQDTLDRIQPAADNLYQAAVTIYEGGDLARAENLLQQAIGLNPNHLRANELLAEILIGGGRLGEAREKLEKLQEVAPNSARPRLVQVYLSQAEAAGDDASRLALFEKVLGLDTTRPEARAGVEKIKAEQERIRQLEQAELERIRQLEQEEKELGFNFLEGRQALQRGEWNRAIELLQIVVAKRPAYTYDDKKDAETAADLLARAARENKTRPSRWKIWLRQTQTLVFMGSVLLILLTIFSGSFGKAAFDTCVDFRTGYCGTFAPTFTLTPTATLTITPTVTLTITPTTTNALQPTVTLTAITPTPQAKSTQIRAKDNMVLVFVPNSKVGDYWIDQTDVTTEQFLLFLNAIKVRVIWQNNNLNVIYQDNIIYHLPDDNNKQWDRVAWSGIQFSLKISKYAKHPVIYVTWYGANKYCEWLGDGSRLPSEIEWQYAAAGPENQPYPWGTQLPNNKLANFDNNVGDTTKVGAYSPQGDSYFGVQDMAGNVWQWVYDLYDISARVLRGGSWLHIVGGLRGSDRFWSNSGDAENYIGFRCVRSR